MTAGPRALVLRAAGLGDILTVVPALRALRTHRPDHHLVVATPPAYHELLLANDLADEVVAVGGLERLPDHLEGVDLAVNLHGCGPASHRCLLALHPQRMLAHANRSVPYDGGPRWGRSHEVWRWCALLQHFGIPADADDLLLAVPPPPSDAGDLAGAVVLHSGAAHPARRWPAGHWVELGRSLRAAGRRIVLTGTTPERRPTLALAEAMGVPSADVLAGRTSVLELAGVLAAARAVVVGDTGVAHLASAMAAPSVVLFGPVPPAAWGPPARPWHVVLWRGGARHPHERQADAGLASITPAEVRGALVRCLAADARRSATRRAGVRRSASGPGGTRGARGPHA